VRGEIHRFHDVLDRAKERLRQIRERVEATTGPQEAAIFDVQRSILDDQELISAVEELIKQNLGAEKAFEIVMFEWTQRFSRHAHPMLRERVGDLKDVEIRVLTLLLDLPDHDPVDLPKGANAILVTHDLTPSLTVQLDRQAIAGIATDAGTRTSHVAILARSLGLPAVVGLRIATQELTGRETVILDGSTGILAINPSHQDIESYASVQGKRKSPKSSFVILLRSTRSQRTAFASHCARTSIFPRRRSGRTQWRRGRLASCGRSSSWSAERPCPRG
jgi:phosphotransferase system enzyme I (PtsI)